VTYRPIFEPEFLKATLAEEAEKRLIALLISDWLDAAPEMRQQAIRDAAAIVSPSQFLSEHYRAIYRELLAGTEYFALKGALPQLSDLIVELEEYTHPDKGIYIPFWQAKVYAEAIVKAYDKRQAYIALTAALKALYDPGKTAAEAVAVVRALPGVGPEIRHAQIFA
jgi:hypothetical protein